MRAFPALAAFALLACGMAHAADAPARPDPANPPLPPPLPATMPAAHAASVPAIGEASEAADPKEPNVKRTVIDGDKTRIEELRVRGQLQSVKVTNKGRAPNYEILVPEGGVDQSDNVIPTRGGAGRRVWNIFRF